MKTQTPAADAVDKPDETTPHVLVVDDDTRIRKLLRQYLMDNGYRVTTAGDAAEARDKLRSLAFDLLVLDVMMPGEDGFDLTEALRGRSQVPILLLTARSDADDRIAGFERGADDYLAKPFEPRELLLRIASILRRAAPAQPQRGMLRLGEREVDLDRAEIRTGDRIERLSTAEVTLLRAFARRPGEPLTRAELAEQMGGGQERTIDVQITRLRRKLEDDARIPRYLQTVRGVGYILWPDDASED